MKELPFDLVLHIFSFLSVSDLARLIPEGDSRWQLACKKVLLSRVKQESWQFELYSSLAYFAMLCNPCVKNNSTVNLICKGYDSYYTESIRFEALSPSVDNDINNNNNNTSSSNDNDTILITDTNACSCLLMMYCRYWQKPFTEGDPEGMITLDWHLGHQTYKTQNISVDYTCSYLIQQKQQSYNNDNNSEQQRILKINRIMVSLDWFRQRLICQYRNIFSF